MATCDELKSQIELEDALIASLDLLIASYDFSIAVQKIAIYGMDTGAPVPMTYTAAVAWLEQLQVQVPPPLAIIAAYITLVGLLASQGQLQTTRSAHVANRAILQDQYVAQGC